MRIGRRFRRWLLTGALVGTISLAGGVLDFGRQVAETLPPRCTPETDVLVLLAERDFARGAVEKGGRAAREAVRRSPQCGAAHEALAYWAMLAMMRGGLAAADQDRAYRLCIRHAELARRYHQHTIRLSMTLTGCFDRHPPA